MGQHIIPVAFEVTADTEAEAARIVVERLQAAHLIAGGADPRLESWWTPNHAEADRNSDEGDRLVWTKVARSAVVDAAVFVAGGATPAEAVDWATRDRDRPLIERVTRHPEPTRLIDRLT